MKSKLSSAKKSQTTRVFHEFFRYQVYHALVILAGRTQQVGLVYTDMETLKSQFAGCPPTNEQWQEVYKLLHEVLRSCKRSEEASQVMIELLDTYTTENASQAREETHKCIVASIGNVQL